MAPFIASDSYSGTLSQTGYVIGSLVFIPIDNFFVPVTKIPGYLKPCSMFWRSCNWSNQLNSESEIGFCCWRFRECWNSLCQIPNQQQIWSEYRDWRSSFLLELINKNVVAKFYNSTGGGFYLQAPVVPLVAPNVADSGDSSLTGLGLVPDNTTPDGKVTVRVFLGYQIQINLYNSAPTFDLPARSLSTPSK